MSKFSKLLDDIDIPGDAFYLQKYRAFHNHPLDTNMMEHNALIMEKDIHRKGAINILPQGPIAIQELCGKRRREIKTEIAEANYSKQEDDYDFGNFEQPKRNSTITTADLFKEESQLLNFKAGEEGLGSCISNASKKAEPAKKPIEWYLKYDESEFLAFEQIERTTTLYKCDEEFDQISEYRVIEPLGMLPALVLVDNTDDDDLEEEPSTKKSILQSLSDEIIK